MVRAWLVFVHAPEASQALPGSFERPASYRVNVERKFGRLDRVLRGAHARARAPSEGPASAPTCAPAILGWDGA
jgi:hypothetical protein